MSQEPNIELGVLHKPVRHSSERIMTDEIKPPEYQIGPGGAVDPKSLLVVFVKDGRATRIPCTTEAFKTLFNTSDASRPKHVGLKMASRAKTMCIVHVVRDDGGKPKVTHIDEVPTHGYTRNLPPEDAVLQENKDVSIHVSKSGSLQFRGRPYYMPDSAVEALVRQIDKCDKIYVGQVFRGPDNKPVHTVKQVAGQLITLSAPDYLNGRMAALPSSALARQTAGVADLVGDGTE